MPLVVSVGPITPAQVLAEGTILIEDTEDILVEAHSSNPFKIMGYVNLCNLVSGDKIILKQYMIIKKGGEYGRYDTAQYEDEQENPLVYVESKETIYGIKFTVHQDTGIPLEIDFQFFKTRV